MNDELNLTQIVRAIWRHFVLVAGITIAFSSASLVYALMATEWYRAEVLLAPAEEKSVPVIPGQLAGLASIAGVSIGDGQSAEAIATLKSRDLAREFIVDNDLMPEFFPERWNAESRTWDDAEHHGVPDVRDAIRYFHRKALKVEEDKQSGLVTLAIEWRDPVIAADWAVELVGRANQRLRERAIRDAEANLEYLRKELLATEVVSLQQSISGLLQKEMQKLMLARGSHEFAFRIVDPAEPPNLRLRPKRTMLVVFGTLFGAMFGALCAVLLDRVRQATGGK